jgi:hypothetical protein
MTTMSILLRIDLFLWILTSCKKLAVEIYMISNSIEKQINDCIKRCCHKKGWLKTRDVRSGNVSSLETRHLMKVIVDRGFAFSNQVVWQDERYQICF